MVPKSNNKHSLHAATISKVESSSNITLTMTDDDSTKEKVIKRQRDDGSSHRRQLTMHGSIQQQGHHHRQQQQLNELQREKLSSQQKKHQRQQKEQNERNQSDRIQDYIPAYLRQFVQPYHGDFCFSVIFHHVLVSQLMIEGFLTIAGPGYLLPKLHEHRCVIDLPNAFHISKSTRKKANRFYITINKAFDDVVAGCHEQHESTCWLYPQLVQAFRCIYDQCQQNTPSFSYVTKIIGDNSSPRPCHLRFYSIEVWNKETGNLAGGELGYTVGSIYTSLTGFSAEDSAGSVQLAALGCLLMQHNFTMWDLGMEMEYKKGLGSALIPRKDFVAILHSVREQYGHLILKEPDNANCRDVIQGYFKDR